jgi:hypothetical protein
MAKVWITYAWEDNKDSDVDFIAQELMKSGLEVKLDRWNIGAGKRLWEQIEKFICKPEETDTWIFYATQNSLGSEPCKEEYSYALDRALKSREDTFPIIGLFSKSIDENLIPAGIKTRLFVRLTDPDWIERIIAAAEKRSPKINHFSVQPYVINRYQNPEHPSSKYVYELRPRAGTWCPFFVAIPIEEKNSVNPEIYQGPINRPPFNNAVLFMGGEGVSKDKKWYILTSQTEATPTQSFYLFCKKTPSKIIFGVMDGKPIYVVELTKLGN